MIASWILCFTVHRVVSRLFVLSGRRLEVGIEQHQIRLTSSQFRDPFLRRDLASRVGQHDHRLRPGPRQFLGERCDPLLTELVIHGKDGDALGLEFVSAYCARMRPSTR